MQQLFPDARPVRVDEVYADLDLPAGDGTRPGVALNAASTVDGKVAVAGTVAGIGSRTDRRLMRQVRAAADGLMIGAGTLRAETVDPRVPDDLADARERAGRERQPLAIAVSATLDLDPGLRFFAGGRNGTLVLTTATAPRERERALVERAQVARLGEHAVNLPAALRFLRSEFGIARLLVEGGPSLNQTLLDGGLVDELFWTIAPKLAGGAGLTMIQAGSPPRSIAASLGLVSLFENDGELFARYRVRPADRTADTVASETSRG